MPDVKPGESEKSFISRCIPILIREGREQDQAVAICNSMWRKAKGIKKENETPKPSGNVDFIPTEGILSKSDDEDDFDYTIPITIDEIKEGHIVSYKNKIGKVIKVIE